MELRIATNIIEKMQRWLSSNKRRDAAAGQEDALRGQLESIGHHLRATGGGINDYASQLGGFKAEVKDHLKQFRKLLEKVVWDWCQGPKARSPMWEVVNTAVTQLAFHFEASKQFNEKLLGGQNELVVVMKHMNEMFQEVQTRRQQKEQPVTPPKAPPNLGAVTSSGRAMATPMHPMTPMTPMTPAMPAYAVPSAVFSRGGPRPLRSKERDPFRFVR